MYVNISRSKQYGKVYARYLIWEQYLKNGIVKQGNVANIPHCSPEETDAIRFALIHQKYPALFCIIFELYC
jgi:hypothetical protein